MPINDRQWLPRAPDGEFDLFEADRTTLLRSAGGVYVLLQRQRWGFRYPYGASRVFYIGQAGPFSSRLREHQRYATQAWEELDEHDEFQSYWLPRYCYAASLGARVLWFSTRGTQIAGGLEADMCELFFDAFGSIPIANGQFPRHPRFR